MMNKLYVGLGYLNHLLYYSILWFFVGGICTLQLLSDSWTSLFYVGTFLYFGLCLYLKAQSNRKRIIVLGISSIVFTLLFGTSSWYVLVFGWIYYLVGGYFYLKV